MKLSLISGVLSVAAMAAASINTATATWYSNNDKFNVAWVGGSDPCTFVKINPNGQNPCGIRFTTKNKYTYYVSPSKSSGPWPPVPPVAD